MELLSLPTALGKQYSFRVSAFVMRGSLASAYILDGQGIAQLRSLTLGAAQGNLIEVLSGISAGEKLVDAPSDRDLAGKRIEVQP